MGGSFKSELLDSDIDAECPGCEYPLWIRLVEVVAGCAVVCPVCRSRVWLRDGDGSAQNAATEIDNAMDELAQAIEGMFK